MDATARVMLKAAAIILGLAMAFWVGLSVAAHREQPAQPQSAVAAHEEHAATIYTCSMHPQIRQPKPGKCPICGMDLVPVSQGADTTGAREYAVSPEAAKLMEIDTAPVERRAAEVEVRMTGKVAYDETKLAYLTAWVPGRLDKLHVNFTGVEVKTGDAMVDIYSPDLIAAQEELLLAARAVAQFAPSAQNVPSMAQVTLDAAREKLRLWGITAEQIADIEKSGAPAETVTLRAPVEGVVVQREGQLGLYVQTGTQLYTIVDLSTVWVKLDAYESDLALLRLGQKVTVTVEALPGETFDGTVAFIDPIVQPMSRTVKVRVNVPNPELRLKPEMFVRATIHAPVGEGAALMIPATAPLLTGKRAVVYVQVAEGEQPAFEGREVTLGPRAGAYYVVVSGLEEGDMVVTRGNFKIDSALQIQGKPSMMQPEGAAMGLVERAARPELAERAPSALAPLAPAPTTRSPEPLQAFRSQLGKAVESYLTMSDALASDKQEAAAKALAEMKKSLDGVDMKLLAGPAHEAWMKTLRALEDAIARMEKAGDIKAFRAEYGPLSIAMIAAVKQFGADRTLYVIHCPMAFNNRGADWLQQEQEVRNPYFGSAMLKCGETTETLPATSQQPGARGHE